eukprot:6492151-Amphidinium_carterae.1
MGWHEFKQSKLMKGEEEGEEDEVQELDEDATLIGVAAAAELQEKAIPSTGKKRGQKASAKPNPEEKSTVVRRLFSADSISICADDSASRVSTALSARDGAIEDDLADGLPGTTHKTLFIPISPERNGFQ